MHEPMQIDPRTYGAMAVMVAGSIVQLVSCRFGSFLGQYNSGIHSIETVLV